jgi:hypothetical protein
MALDNHDHVTLLAERLQQMQKRLDELETTQKEMQRVINRYIGGSAILVGVGVFVGWLFTIGSGALTFLQR